LDDASARAREGVECAHKTGLARLAGHPRVKRCRVLGTMAAFDLDGEQGYLNPIGPELSAYALEEGVLLRPLGNVVYLLPPYCSTADDLGHAYDVIEGFLGGAQ
jgi:adenosylmethionine-8-amino-7-oxononanoate aminotransferase